LIRSLSLSYIALWRENADLGGLRSSHCEIETGGHIFEKAVSNPGTEKGPKNDVKKARKGVKCRDLTDETEVRIKSMAGR
jgi:hypothetical protein